MAVVMLANGLTLRIAIEEKVWFHGLLKATRRSDAEITERVARSRKKFRHTTSQLIHLDLISPGRGIERSQRADRPGADDDSFLTAPLHHLVP
jgi:hypothetical protein